MAVWSSSVNYLLGKTGGLLEGLGERQTAAASGHEDGEYPRKSKLGFPGSEEGLLPGGAGEEYTRRVELRRNIASLQNALGHTEDQLNSTKRQLKRERERADRVEALYLKQKSALHTMELEVRRLKGEFRPFRR